MPSSKRAEKPRKDGPLARRPNSSPQQDAAAKEHCSADRCPKPAKDGVAEQKKEAPQRFDRARQREILRRQDIETKEKCHMASRYRKKMGQSAGRKDLE